MYEWRVIRPKESSPNLRDRISSQRDKQMRMIASFIIHYLGWQAARGFGATGPKCPFFAQLPSAAAIRKR